MEFNCAHCGNLTDKPAGHVNRSRAQGNNLYCSRECSGFGRRSGKTVDQLKAEKRAYDIQYRQRDPDARKVEKAEYHRRTYDPAKAAEQRKKIMPRHIQYCRKPEYRAWKKSYDRQYRAVKFYGEFADCYRLVLDIRDECLSRMTDYEIRQEKGTLNKSTQRKRDYERSIRNNPEVGPLGNLERGERGQNGRIASGFHRLSSSGNPPHDEHATPHLAASKAAGLG